MHRDSFQLMKDELLKEAPYNVIIVDWSDWNGFPYTQAVANARVVGAHVAKLIRHLMENKGAIPQSFHLIGHSLGGQVSGWAGERIPDLGRITGLDPAGPFFQNAENEVRLDTSDATFVDVIHSNGGNNVYEGKALTSLFRRAQGLR
ncbi:UNVERIFIED_CONTAM: Pancreatic lipase-related protein 3 [Trichonephila clavipes]